MVRTAVASASSDDGEDIGARLLRLNLPSKPLIMSKLPDMCGGYCRRTEAESCWCYEYTTMLFRPEYEDKWLLDNPEPPETKVLLNGSSRKGGDGDGGTATGGAGGGGGGGGRSGSATATTNGKVTEKKKFSLGQYTEKLAGKMPAKTNSVGSAGSASKISPVMTGSKKSKEGSADSQETVRNSREVRRSPSRDDPPPKRKQQTPSPLRPRPPPPAPAIPNLPLLPPLLSPTLPPAVEEALLLEDNRSRGVTRDDGYESSVALGSRKRQRAPSDTEKSGRKTIAPGKKLPGSRTNTPSRSPRQTNISPTKALSNKTISRSSLGGNTTPKPVASKTVQKRPASPKQSSPLPRSSKTASKFPLAPTTTAAGPEKKSLVVRLKYSKRRARDVATLMRLRPNPKRQRQEDLLPAPAAKRQKVPDSLAVSAASGRSPAFKSPAALKVLKERDITTPPKKVNGHLNTTALKRTGSEGHAQTPSKDERNGIPRKPLDSSIQSRVEAFRNEYLRYADLGKTSKHEADRTFKLQTETQPDREKTRYATVVAVDSVLCYILSFMCEEEAKALEQRSPPIDTWRSIVPLSKFVAEKSLIYPPLHGLCKQLEATIRQHLFDMEIAVYEKLPLPDTISKAPTPDSGTNGTSIDRATYLRQKSLITKEARELKDCWLDGMRYLTHDDIQNHFPQTFAKRSKKFVDPATATPKLGNYKHQYQLPLHRNTTMIEALNFGYLFLQEWAATEGILFKSKLSSCLETGERMGR